MTTATNMLRLTPELEQCRCEAVRILDEHNPGASLDDLDQTMMALAHRAYRRAIEPYLKAKTSITILFPAKIVLHADGAVESIPWPLTPEQQRTMDALDQMIAAEAKRYGFTLSE